MKPLLLKTLLLLATTLNCNCEDNNTNDSTGDDSFSCDMNGQLYIPSAGTGIGGGDIRPFAWSYSNLDDPTVPYFFNLGGIGNYTVALYLVNPSVGENILNEQLDDTIDFTHSGMIVKNSNEFYNTRNNQNNGYVNFTEFSETKVVGTFECILYDEDGNELRVTNGKFNLSLDSKKN